MIALITRATNRPKNRAMTRIRAIWLRSFPPSVKFTPKYNIVGGEGGIIEFFKLLLLVTQEPMQSLTIVAFLLLTDSGSSPPNMS